MPAQGHGHRTGVETSYSGVVEKHRLFVYKFYSKCADTCHTLEAKLGTLTHLGCNGMCTGRTILTVLQRRKI